MHLIFKNLYLPMTFSRKLVSLAMDQTSQFSVATIHGHNKCSTITTVITIVINNFHICLKKYSITDSRYS